MTPGDKATITLDEWVTVVTVVKVIDPRRVVVACRDDSQITVPRSLIQIAQRGQS